VNRIRLDGCSPEPLASYLKALAVLRLVSEQRDPDACGWWDGDAFVLESKLDHASLVRFFLEDYAPSPFVAPWNGGSGFYPGDNTEGVNLIRSSESIRFKCYREALKEISTWQLMKAELKSRKEAIIAQCRRRLADVAIDWIDAAVGLTDDRKPSYAPILGTGGNEGRLEYTNSFMRRIADLLLSSPPHPSCAALLRNALFAEPTEGLSKESVGQHDPGRAGGFNQGSGIENKDFPTNPWNFVLTFEGSPVWAGSVTRRQSMLGGRLLASPFTVRASPVGYSSGAASDAATARAEIWTPLWDRPASYPEVRSFLSEGRAEVGTRPARAGIEFAEAASSLGVDRGISQFVRYALLKRRGDSYVALPTGRFNVRFRSESDLIRELNPLTARLDQFIRGMGDNCPASLKSARRNIDSAIYELLRQGGPNWACALVRSCGALEQQLARRAADKNTHRPISGLSPRWIEAADDGSVEVRLAAALASINGDGKVGPLRASLAPIDPIKPWLWAERGYQTAWRGNSLAASLAEVLARRMMDAERLGSGNNPVFGALRLNPRDIAAFIEGEVNEQLLEDLLFGFTWGNWRHQAADEVLAKINRRWSQPVSHCIVLRAWALLKLLFLPGPLRVNGADVRLRAESSIVPLLRADRIGDACEAAARRLYTSGLAPLRARFPDAADGPRIAAALIFPVRSSTELMALVVAPPARNQEGADV
jgi:CRISPR-associated protein Csx17